MMTNATLKALFRPMFLWALPIYFLYFGLPIISKEFGASATAIGGLFSIFTGTTLILRPLTGWAIDRYGRKLFLVAALIFYAAAMTFFAFAENMESLYLARVLQGIGSAMLWSAANTIVADLTQTENRGKALGRLSGVTTIGGMTGATFAGVMMALMPEGDAWFYAFLTFTGMMVIAAILAWLTVPETKPAERAQRRSSMITPLFIRLLAIVFITGLPEAMLAPLYMTYLLDKFSTDGITLAWAFFPAGIISALLATRLGSFSDRFGRVPMMALGLAGAGLISFFMPHLPAILWLTLAYTLTSIFWRISEPAETALVADLTQHDQRGRAYGIYDFVENLGFTIGPLLGGIFYDRYSSGLPFYLNGIFLLIGAGLVLLLLKGASDRHASTP